MVTITLAELEAEFGQIAIRATTLYPCMQVGGIMYLSEIQERFDQSRGPDGKPWVPLKYPRPQGGTKPLQSNGLFRGSFHASATTDSFAVGTNAIQSNLMHYGGTVVPKNAKALTIPLTKAAVYAGKARNMQGLFVARNKNTGRAYLARQEGSGKRKKLVYHWLLTMMVKIPARPIVGASKRFLDSFKPILVNYLRTGRLNP